MRVLLIKTSSMGDLIHTLPALTDAGKAIPDIRFDWAVEDAFAEIPQWHPLVNKVIPVALRRWRKDLLSSKHWAEWSQLRDTLRAEKYDHILDAQGLVKSAFLTLFAKGVRTGLDFRSARETLAALAYQKRCTVNFYQHAIVRMRSLFSQALGYSLPSEVPEYGLTKTQFQLAEPQTPYLVFLHGTTWTTKQWPETYWMQLAEKVSAAGYGIKISGGNPQEVERAQRIAAHCQAVEVLPYLSIQRMATLLANARAAVAVDTGFLHLAAALDIPTVSLYGATNPTYTGALGRSAVHLAADFACSPCLRRDCTYREPASVTPACYATLTPERVWNTLANLLP